MNQLLEVLGSFKRVSSVIHALYEEGTKEFDLNFTQMVVLRCLQNKPWVNMTDLPIHSLTSNTTISVLVEKLVRKGLVERKYSEVDRRRVMLSLTDEGNATIQKIFSDDSTLMRTFREVFDLPAKDLQELMRIHQRIIDNSELRRTRT
ncbi:MarR family winged helix-turn-helix transcriptional regulator [Alicyclobacillus dauci]|uniref:MarR family transcriptional regulator n=1 Tax=Alicyclobacillus dauci TaxID=1475485 RepID=A0ABY6Z4J9_9BACL|nr:MarR family transcriptional regulator [Alicyclobacillus dauci]WAH37804.1 MarR family transcriptional regulator [Alicyclobacillus dauci]